MATKTSQTENTAAAVEAPATPAVPAFKIKARVTVPLLRLELDKQYYLLFESEPYKAKPITGTDSDKKEPPILARVVDLSTGEHAEIILGAVLDSELRDAYPEGIAGRAFAIAKHKLESKRYATWDIAEIEVPA